MIWLLSFNQNYYPLETVLLDVIIRVLKLLGQKDQFSTGRFSVFLPRDLTDYDFLNVTKPSVGLTTAKLS